MLIKITYLLHLMVGEVHLTIGVHTTQEIYFQLGGV